MVVPRLDLAAASATASSLSGPPPTAGPTPTGFLSSAGSYPPIPSLAGSSINTNNNNSNSSGNIAGTANSGGSARLGSYTPRDAVDVQLQQQLLQDERVAEELARQVLQAAVDTAQSLGGDAYEFNVKRQLVYSCNAHNEEKLRKVLRHDPTLATARIAEMGNLAADGQTALHVAAAAGNVDGLKILLEMGSEASCWIRDLQGRTPLHLAAQNNQTEACVFLRQRMEAERKVDPVGVDAPCDLAGTRCLSRR